MYKICFPILILGLLLVYKPVQAQEKTPVTVYLKNGKVLQGAVITSIFEEYLTLEIDEVTHLNIQLNKIKSIYFGKYTREGKTKPAFEPKVGFIHAADIGLLFGNNAYGSGSSPSVNIVNSFQFNSYVGTGLGLGLDLHGNITTLPVYVNLKGALTKKKVTPYYFLNAGYAFAWDSENDSFIEYDKVQGGWLLQPGFGYQFNMAQSALLVGLGYRIQKMTLDYHTSSWGWGNSDIFYHEERTLRRLSLSVGITF